MASSSRYWQRRTAQRVVDAEQQVLAFERSFRRQYRAAVGNIDHQITSLYRRYAEENAMDYMEAYQYLSDSHRLEFQADLTDYIAGMKDAEYRSRNYNVLHALSTRARVRRLEAMRASIRLEAGQLYSRLGSESERLLQDVFSEGYERTVFDTFQRLGMGINFEQANPRLFQTLLQNPWSGREFSQKIWRLEDGFVEALESTLVRGLIQGQSIDAMATYLHVAALGNASGGNGRGGCFWQAQRLIRTEANYMLNQAAEAAYKELGVERYQYLATLDNRTSDACQELDGKVIEVSKAVPGLNYPPLHPYCRSTTIPYFDDLEGNRIARAEDGSSYHVPGDMTFEQWREQLAAGTLVKVEEVAAYDLTTEEAYASIQLEVGALSLDSVRGASGAIRRSDTKRMDEHAKRYYEAIRNRTSDAVAIAANTGFSVEEVELVRRHLFLDTHELDGGRISRFDPDFYIAVSWQRLIDGRDIREMDMILLHHELLELTLMAQGLSYDEAHEQTESLYNYSKAVKEMIDGRKQDEQT